MAHPTPKKSSLTALLPLGKPFIELQSVDSTNNYARSLLDQEAAAHGTAVFAHAQFRGKGQRGKQWDSEPGANLILTLIIDPKIIGVREPFGLSACIALSLTDLFSQHVGKHVSIKWPNDLYWKDKKAGGILIENIIMANSREWKWAIVGIGININQIEFPPELSNPVSMKQITGNSYDPIELSKKLCDIISFYLHLINKKGFSFIVEKYNDQLYKRKETIKLRKDNRSFEVKLKGVSTEGKLIVANGLEKEFSYEEIEWVK